MGFLLWPFKVIGGAISCAFVFIGGLLALVVGAVGRLLSLILGLIMLLIGIALCASGIGLIVGIPLTLFGGSLMLRAIF